jgi:predicted ATPase
MRPCKCREPHAHRRIVLTGGPGAGKTAVLELIRQYFCAHVKVLPEAAGIVFGGGFPLGDALELRRAAQRAIFYVQRELEAAGDANNPAIVLCDRGTVDGAAYWPGPGELWAAVGP